MLHMGGPSNYLMESYALLDSILFAYPDAVVYVLNTDDAQFANYLSEGYCVIPVSQDVEQIVGTIFL